MGMGSSLCQPLPESAEDAFLSAALDDMAWGLESGIIMTSSGLNEPTSAIFLSRSSTWVAFEGFSHLIVQHLLPSLTLIFLSYKDFREIRADVGVSAVNEENFP
ncbi:hypothetical protein H1C71_014968 [Ictidomys tridecemlineatus]|nr:hypothetical protein H1C71_014968 [Ictidomys tridecemlineatus]